MLQGRKSRGGQGGLAPPNFSRIKHFKRENYEFTVRKYQNFPGLRFAPPDNYNQTDPMAPPSVTEGPTLIHKKFILCCLTRDHLASRGGEAAERSENGLSSKGLHVLN